MKVVKIISLVFFVLLSDEVTKFQTSRNLTIARPKQMSRLSRDAGSQPQGSRMYLLPAEAAPGHTQVPWWWTVYLRCLRTRPLSLSSAPRCWDVSTRALAIATPRGRHRKRDPLKQLIASVLSVGGRGAVKGNTRLQVDINFLMQLQRTTEKNLKPQNHEMKASHLIA